MGSEQESAVRAFVAEFEGAEWDAAQIERILSHLAPDAGYQVYAWEPPVVGHDAIGADLLRQAHLFRDLTSEIVTMASVGQTVVAERLDSLTINDKPVTLHVAAFFEVNPAGKIVNWREYLDSNEVAAKVGAGVSSAGTRT
jgi:limonene-1,2-epoxide hydrolase